VQGNKGPAVPGKGGTAFGYGGGQFRRPAVAGLPPEKLRRYGFPRIGQQSLFFFISKGKIHNFP
jgi:hypothetical protein